MHHDLAVETLHDLACDLRGMGITIPKPLDDYRKKKSTDTTEVLRHLRNLLADFKKKTESAKKEVKGYGKEITYSGYDHPDPSIQERIDELRAIYWKFNPVEERILEIIGQLEG
ncbi:hypothetical protein [Shimazuella alba]|uniref:Uncharacterized protein n=1 Tax=Shimazuella alba TaxID=2690964 RepID=A0A6I4W2S5_9BACL|nr:hypothetical protein [Shimazuella alba]MXQ54562.1 hypothetical protein [Shimazuella alba]